MKTSFATTASIQLGGPWSQTRLAVCMAMAVLVGCDSSDDGDPNAGRDTGGDASIDAPEDSTDPDADTALPDTPPDGDVGPDADTTVPDADPDAEVGPDVPPLDCDVLPICETDADCGAPQLCIAGVCADPVDPVDTEVRGTFYRLTRARLANAAGPFGLDQNGDGEIDNLLGRIIVSLPGGQALVEREVNAFLTNDLLTLGVDVVRLPGVCGDEPGTEAAQVLIYAATRDLAGDGLTASELEDANTLRLRPSTFDGLRGPNCAMMVGSIDATTDVIRAQGGQLCNFPISLFDGATLNLPLRDVHVRITPGSANKDGEGATATLAGSVRVSDLVDEANRLAPDCACAGIDTTTPIAETFVQGGRVAGRCIQDVRGASACDLNADGRACTNLPGLCTGLIVLGAQTDLSTGESGEILDAFSFGLEADMFPADLANPPVGPALQAFGDHWETNRSLQVQPGITAVRVAPMANDEFDDTQDTLQAVGEVEPSGLPVTLARDGNKVQVTVGEGWPTSGTETFSFSYTIGNGGTRASTATVTMRAIARTPAVEITSDSYTVLLPVTAPVPFRVLENDIPPIGAAIGLREVDPPLRGTATIGDSQTILYTPPDTVGTDGFTYRAIAYTELGRESLLAGGLVSITVDCQPGYWGTTCTPCETCVGGTCNDGAEGDGTCVDINECEAEPCGPDQGCENTVGSYVCTCPEGFVVNASDCDDVNECDAIDGGDLCDENEVCVNTPGDYLCRCAPGFYLADDDTCVLDDVCSTNPCDPVEEQCALMLEEPGYVCVPTRSFEPVHSVTSDTDYPGVAGFGTQLELGGGIVVIGDEEIEASASSTWVFDFYQEPAQLTRFLGVPTPLVAIDPFGESGFVSGRTGFPVQIFDTFYDEETFEFGYEPTSTISPAEGGVEGFATALASGGQDVAIGRQLSIAGAPGFVELYRVFSDLPVSLVDVLSRPGVAVPDGFGAQIAMSFSHVLVSAPDAGTDGEVWMFTRQGEEWIAQLLPMPEAARGGRFGATLALDAGGYVAYVAAPDATVRGRENTGLVAVYAPIRGTWTLRDVLIPAVALPAQRFGAALGADYSHLAVGAPGYQEDRGRVYLYDPRGEGEGTGDNSVDPLYLGEIEAPYGPGARFGHAVDVSFGSVAIGAPGANRVDIYSTFRPN